MIVLEKKVKGKQEEVLKKAKEFFGPCLLYTSNADRAGKWKPGYGYRRRY